MNATLPHLTAKKARDQLTYAVEEDIPDYQELYLEWRLWYAEPGPMWKRTESIKRTFTEA